MRRLIIVALAAALLLTSCVSNKALYIAPEEKSSQSSPSSIGAKSQDGLQIVAGSDYFDGKNANFMLSLASLDQRTFTFNDTDIAIYGGNSDKDRWTLIENWNSSDYIVHEKNRASAAIAAAGVIGALAVIDAIMNPDDSNFYFDFYYGYPWGYHSSVYYRATGPVGAAFTALGVIESTVVLSQMSEMYQAELEHTVLQSGAVTPEKPVSGSVSFSNLPTYPDYKLVFNNGKQDMEFTFMRSDREEIINPWADRSSTQVALNYTYTIGIRRSNFMLNILPPKYFGAFLGISFFPKMSAENLAGSVGGSIGVNMKLMPYIWLQGGIEVFGKEDESEDIGLLATTGLELCINHISVYGGAVYDIIDRSFYAEVGGGLAF